MILNSRNGDKLDIELIKQTKPKYIFFVHWNDRIPDELIDKYNCVCFHMTDLPFGRGGSPLQNLIERGIYQTKITAFKATKEMDAGPVYIKCSLDLSQGSADTLYFNAYRIIDNMIEIIQSSDLIPIEQTGEPTFFKRRKPEQSEMSNVPFNKVKDHIRMLDAEGYPNAYLQVNDYRIYFKKAFEYADKSVFSEVRICKL